MMYESKYNGQRISESRLASLMLEHESGSSATDRLESHINWAVENCTNINNIFLANAIEHLWCNIIGIWNNNLHNYMDNKIEGLVEEGLVINW